MAAEIMAHFIDVEKMRDRVLKFNLLMLKAPKPIVSAERLRAIEQLTRYAIAF